MPERISQHVVTVGIVTIAAIAIAGALTYTRVELLSDASAYVNRSERVRYALQRTLSTVQDAESGVRGYLITHEDPFLEPFLRSRTELDSNLQALTGLLADNPSQLERFRDLDRLARARLDRLNTVVTQIRDGTFVMPNAPRASSEAKKLMDSFRAQVTAMQAYEATRLSERLRLTAQARREALIATVSMSGIAVGLVLLLILVSRRAAAKVRASQRWLGTTLNSIGDGVIATDAQGSIRFLNPVAAELTGWSQAEAQGRGIDEVFRIVGMGDHQPTESPVARLLRQSTLAGAPDQAVLVSRDGSEFPIEDSGAPIRDEKGEIQGVVVVFKDASAARAAQVALKASEERQRLALEGAELGALDHDLAKGTAVWNERLHGILGFSPGIPLDTGMINRQVYAEDRELVRASLQNAKANRAPFRCEHRIVRASDQAVRWIAANGIYVYDKDGEATRFIGVVRDVTENRRLESQERQAQKLDALGTLAGGIAHDFNNILAVLRGNLAVIRSELAANSEITASVADMDNACNRATALVRQILTFGSRQDQERKVLQLESVVKDGMRLLRATLPAEIEIRCNDPLERLPPVLVDPNQIHQVITNLGINAAHAIGRRQGTIEVYIESVQVDATLAATSPDLREGRYVRLRFCDNGCGMSRAVMDRIFEPFFSTKTPQSGTGLGLSVVRGIMKNHDAAISVYSELNRGTRFHLYFPVASNQAQAGQIVTPAAPKRGQGERILYLDDEESLVILAKRMLERMGYHVSGFKDAAQAIAAFAATPQDFDLVLTDLSMPGMSGMEVARQILAIRPDVPVLLATGYVRTEDVEQARAIGIREVIWKPQTIGEMGDLLAQQLQKLVPAQP
ncbi:MAG: CHASE3 domain-containing protein [Proteobacteria bacterium]|nr:CHASE3 domain-containing protein [Pseudomonadota bacterium]